jgi:bacterioferritin-associated ferredoxin
MVFNIFYIIVLIIIAIIILSYLRKNKENFTTEFQEKQLNYYNRRKNDVINPIKNDIEIFNEVKDEKGVQLKLDNIQRANVNSTIDQEVNKCKFVNKCEDLDNSNCGKCLDTGETMYGNMDGPLVDVCPGGWVKTTSQCKKAYERRICAKVKNCMMMTGEASICGWCVEQNKAVVAKQVGDKLVPKYDEDTCGEKGLVKRDDCGKIFMSSNCFKNPGWKSGNHSKSCLNDIWNWVGCSRNGSSSPEKKNTSWWNQRGVYQVLDDMHLYKKYADSNDYNQANRYHQRCYGTKIPDPCDDKYKNKPASCYQKAFIDSGCLKTGSSYPTKPSSQSISDYKNTIMGYVSNAHNEKNDYNLRDLNYNKCYGGTMIIKDKKNRMEPGLNAYVYEARNSYGHIGKKLRDDPIRVNNIDFNWGGSPILGVKSNAIFVSFIGSITYPENASTVKFRLNSDNGSRLYINGVRIIDNWGNIVGKKDSKTITINKSTDNIWVEYYEWYGAAKLQLQWSINGVEWSKIPDKYLNSTPVQKNKIKYHPYDYKMYGLWIPGEKMVERVYIEPDNTVVFLIKHQKFTKIVKLKDNVETPYYYVGNINEYGRKPLTRGPYGVYRIRKFR